MKSRSEALIRRECPWDYHRIKAVVKKAFALASHSDGDEHDLISRIRDSNEYIPELSLVAVENGEIVEFIMFSKILIGCETAIALAPVAVSPSHQRKGIGKSLIEASHEITVGLIYTCSVVLGYPDYYSEFGYGRASEYGVHPPFEVPDEYFMVCKLSETGHIPHGHVKYSKAFVL